MQVQIMSLASIVVLARIPWARLLQRWTAAGSPTEPEHHEDSEVH